MRHGVTTRGHLSLLFFRRNPASHLFIFELGGHKYFKIEEIIIRPFTLRFHGGFDDNIYFVTSDLIIT
jgi:hypothetical protein